MGLIHLSGVYQEAYQPDTPPNMPNRALAGAARDHVTRDSRRVHIFNTITPYTTHAARLASQLHACAALWPRAWSRSRYTPGPHGTRQVNEAALMRARAYATRRLLLRGAAGFGIGYAAGSRER